MRQLASLRPIAETGVTINIVNPGLCITELSRHVAEETRATIEKMRAAIGRTAEMGSRTLLYSAVAGKESHGKYTSECMIRDHDRFPPWVEDDSGKEIQKRVWESLSKKLEAIQPGCI